MRAHTIQHGTAYYFKIQAPVDSNFVSYMLRKSSSTLPKEQIAKEFKRHCYDIKAA
jgi:hypothetical protein